MQILHRARVITIVIILLCIFMVLNHICMISDGTSLYRQRSWTSFIYTPKLVPSDWSLKPLKKHKIKSYGSTHFELNSNHYPPPSRLVNIEGFEYLHNPAICEPDDEVFMLVLVGSKPNDTHLRRTIRETWGNPKITNRPFKLAFMFGMPADPVKSEVLQAEMKLHGDIVQGNFIDSYHNVTIRDLMAMRWAWNYCPQARYVMRADDDISIDIFLLSQTLEAKFRDYVIKNESLLACYLKFIKSEVLREGPYAVSRDDHPGDNYEDYCSGWMYVVNVLMARSLDLASMHVAPYWMNDAYITGTLRHVLNVSLQHIGIPYTTSYKEMITTTTENTIPNRFAFGPVAKNDTLMAVLHQKYKRDYMRMVQEGLVKII